MMISPPRPYEAVHGIPNAKIATSKVTDTLSSVRYLGGSYFVNSRRHCDQSLTQG